MKGKWEVDIGLSQACSFGPHEKKLIMHMFESSLDRVIKEAKKSHKIVLTCWWKNLGCRPIKERIPWDIIRRALEWVNKDE